MKIGIKLSIAFQVAEDSLHPAQSNVGLATRFVAVTLRILRFRVSKNSLQRLRLNWELPRHFARAELQVMLPTGANQDKRKHSASRITPDALPSQDLPGRWLYVSSRTNEPNDQTYPRVGKWMVFLPTLRADAIWLTIREELKSGELSLSAISAKISIFNPEKPNSHVLIVYTSDYEDKATVSNCLLAIRRLGITGKLFYKTDEQTFSGLYAGGAQRPWMYSSDMFEI